MLYDYFRESRYSILLDFASVIYTKKLELSLDRKHAMQQLKLVSLDGAPVPVTFRLSNNGEVRIGFRILRRALMRRGSCAACTSVPHGARSASAPPLTMCTWQVWLIDQVLVKSATNM